MFSITNRQTREVAWRWVLSCACAGVIFLLSSISGDDLPTVAVSDKIIHAAEFGILAVLLCRAIEASWPSCSRRLVITVSVLLIAVYGAIDEAHQSLVDQRHADVTDLAADSMGALLAAWGWQLAAAWRRHKAK
ncbi:hypothetical protein NKDENANG_00802 [Candidatus Entotheonellaceae bacterium PAL068K]